MKYFLIALSRLVYFIDRKHRRYAKANLDLVYQDDMDPQKKELIIKSTYEQMFFNLYTFIENQSVDIEALEKNTIQIDEDVLTQALKANRKIILVTAHYGYWEYGSIFIPIKYGPSTMVGRPLNNKYLNNELNESRKRFKTEMLSKYDASKGLIKALKNDRIVGLVVDQHLTQGVDVMFMGHKVKHVDSASRLAHKFDALIIPVFFTRDGLGQYTVKFYDAIDPREYVHSEDPITELTQKQADVIGEEIRLHPENWLWQHRRWKAYNSEIYS
jgi:KDO2-lipid IV(A) lauroyltransferase